MLLTELYELRPKREHLRMRPIMAAERELASICPIRPCRNLLNCKFHSQFVRRTFQMNFFIMSIQKQKDIFGEKRITVCHALINYSFVMLCNCYHLTDFPPKLRMQSPFVTYQIHLVLPVCSWVHDYLLEHRVTLRDPIHKAEGLLLAAINFQKAAYLGVKLLLVHPNLCWDFGWLVIM